MKTLLRLIWVVALLVFTLRAEAATVGETLKDVELKNADESATNVPDFGAKVLALFYTDADVADMNDPLADALKAKNYDKSVYRGMGIVNLKDSKAPNFIIRGIVKDKIAKYASTIITDPDLKLAAAWGLGDCNNTSVIVIVGADKKVKFIQKGPVRGAEVDNVVKLVDSLIALKAAPTEAAPAPTEPAAPAPTP